MNQEILYSPIHARSFRDPEELQKRLAELALQSGYEWGASWDESGRLSLKPLISPICSGLIGSVMPQEAVKVS
jgi:hypothetical protein